MAERKLVGSLLVAVLVLTSLAVVPLPALADTPDYLVDRLDDVNDAALGGGPFCLDDVDNDCTLRKALQLANGDGAPSRIDFLPGLTGVITLNTSLGSGGLLTVFTEGNTTIDGYNEGTGQNQPTIAINGSGIAVGFDIRSANNSIRGLSLYGFSGFVTPGGAIILGAGATGNAITSNYLGLGLGGVDTGLNTDFGIIVNGGAQTNTISGNTIGDAAQAGIYMTNASATTITGNFIGIGPSNAPRPNGRAGILIGTTPSDGGGVSTGHIIGGTNTTTANTIASNGASGQTVNAGILLRGSGTTTNTIRGNFIGTDRLGLADLGNNGDGIRLEEGARANTIEGSNTFPVLLVGNARHGIYLTGAGTSGNTVRGARIGINFTNAATIPNDDVGIRIDNGASGNTIESQTTPSRRTIIGGNSDGGIVVDSATGTTIRGVFVGLSPTNNLPFGNGGDGVQLNATGSTRIEGSTIVDNEGYGVRVTNALTTTVASSLIGPGLNATATFSNSLGGILVQSVGNADTRSTLIGGAGAGNIIAGNGGPAISIAGSRTVSTTVDANTIGLRKATAGTTAYTVAAGNLGPGVQVSGGPRQTTIGGAGNLIAGQPAFPGVLISGAGTTTTTLTLNRIGSVISGTQTLDLPTLSGVQQTDGPVGTTIVDNTIGPTVEDGLSISGGTRLTISDNTVRDSGRDGFVATGVSGLQARDNTIRGSDRDGTAILTGTNLLLVSNIITGSGRVGLSLTNPISAVVQTSVITGSLGDGVSVLRGSNAALLQNEIRSNGGDGARLTDIVGARVLTNTIIANGGEAVEVAGSARRVRIMSNVVSRNGAGILLAGTTTGGGGSLSAPNHDIDPPIINGPANLRLSVTQGGLIRGYVLTSTNKLENSLNPPSACVSCTVQLFAPDPSLAAPDGQGFVSLGPDLQVPSGVFEFQLEGSLPRQILLTATDGYGNTSAYGVFDVSAGLRLTPIAPSPPVRSAAPGASVSYAFLLEHLGSLDLTDIRLSSQSVNQLNWTTAISPTTSRGLALRAGETTRVTVTLTLPTGSALNVRAGLSDVTRLIAASTAYTRATASALMTTTVLAQPVVALSPLTTSKSGNPGALVTYPYTATNSGNITATVTLTTTTRDAAQSQIWATSITTTSLSIPPGMSRGFTVSVRVPTGAQTSFSGQPVRATTLVTATAAGFPEQTRTVSATTGVNLVRQVTLLRDETGFAAAGEPITFRHRVDNLSNGPATFQLNAFSSQGSQVRFISETPGVTIAPNGTFTLSNRTNSATNETSFLNFSVVVTVNRQLLPGVVDEVDVFVTEPGRPNDRLSTVKDRITITRAPVLPRVWLPMIINRQATPVFRPE